MYRQGYLIIFIGFICFVIGVYGSENVTLEEIPVDTLVNLTNNNELWTILLKDCKEPSLICVQNNIYRYLKNTLDETKDLQFTSYLKFTKNKVDYSEIKRSLDTNSTDDLYLYEDESPIESMTRSLHDNAASFLMTHDAELSLPDGLFPNSFLKISPQGFQNHGALVNLEVVSNDLVAEPGEKEEGRTIKKIRKFISEKLIYAILAILLIIKLLAVKFLFLLPLIIGAAAAKKILLKILLFVFPFLHHVFKFCAYYPIQAKYHHHKHLISHIHEIAPAKYHDHHEEIDPHSHGPSPYEYHEPHGEYEGEVSVLPDDGFGFSHGLISHRKDPTREENEIVPYGKPTRRKPNRPLTSSEIERMVAKAEKEAMIKARLEKERIRIREENLRLQDQLNQAVKLQEKLKQQAVHIHKKVPPTKISASIPYASRPVGTNFHGNSRPIGIESHGPIRGSYLESDGFQRPTVADEPGIELPAGYLIPQHTLPQQTTNKNPFQPSQYDQEYQSSQTNSQHNLNQQIGADLNQGPIYKPASSKDQFNNPNINRIQPLPSSQYDLQQSIEYDPRNPAVFEYSKDTTNKQNKFTQSDNQKSINADNTPEVFEKPVPKPSSRLEQEIYKAASITHDPFYSPIIEKIDRILQELGFNDEPCKEQLICSMYKNPSKYSPHSNLLSSELSRDSSELQKPTSTNSAVIKFYKYVQAARDGQDQRECRRLYPACPINTEVS